MGVTSSNKTFKSIIYLYFIMDINQPTSGSPESKDNNKVEEQKDLKEKMSLPTEAKPVVQKIKRFFRPTEGLPRGAMKALLSAAPKLNVSLPKINMPKFSVANHDSKFKIIAYLINRLREYQRVIMITKKPDMAEFKATAKATGLGITIIGVIGFVITMIVQLLGLI